MILTGKAAEYAEGFEKLDEMLRSKIPGSGPFPLDEDAQIDLFQVTMLYERDKIFHEYIRGCLSLFVAHRVKGVPEVIKLLDKMMEISRDYQ